MRYSGVDYLKPSTPYLALLATPVTFRPEMVVIFEFKYAYYYHLVTSVTSLASGAVHLEVLDD